MSEIGKVFAEFLGKEGVKDETGNTSLTMKSYKDFLAAQGLSKDIQEKILEVEKEVTTGLIRFNADALTAKIKELKNNGKEEEAAKAEVTTRVTTPFGQRRMRTVASQQYPVMGSDTKITKVGVVHDNYKFSRAIDKEVLGTIEDQFKTLLGLE